jgi:hypothetical protein
MHERIQTNLTNLEATGEDLLALSDEVPCRLAARRSRARGTSRDFQLTQVCLRFHSDHSALARRCPQPGCFCRRRTGASPLCQSR